MKVIKVVIHVDDDVNTNWLRNAFRDKLSGCGQLVAWDSRTEPAKDVLANMGPGYNCETARPERKAKTDAE